MKKIRRIIAWPILMAVCMIIFLSTSSMNILAKTSSNNAKKQIVNNGSYFVQVGQCIYYKSYDKESLPTSALWGDFMSCYPDEVGQSDLMCLDLATGKVKKIKKGEGRGKLFFVNDHFYMTFGYDAKLNKMYFGSVALDGSEKRIGEGELIGVDEATGTIITQSYDSTHNSILEIWKDGKKLDTLASKDESSLYFDDVIEGELIFDSVKTNKDYTTIQQLYSYDLKKVVQNKVASKVKLGTFPNCDEFSMVYSQQMIYDGKSVYGVFGAYEGSGGYYAGGYIIKIVPGKENSMSIVEHLSAEDAGYDVPTIAIENEKLKIIPYSEKKTVAEELLESKNISGIVKMIEKEEHINGNTYVVLNTVIYDSTQNIGWRDAYDRLSTAYIKIDDKTNRATVLNQIDCNLKIKARVWIIDQNPQIDLLYQIIDEENDRAGDIAEEGKLAKSFKFNYSNPRESKMASDHPTQREILHDYLLCHSGLGYGEKNGDGTYLIPISEEGCYMEIAFDAEGKIIAITPLDMKSK